MNNDLLISLPKHTAKGGVRSYWDAILPSLQEEFSLQTIEIGGHGLNPIGPLLDQLRFQQNIQKNPPKLAIINPSLGFNSFFRDGFFTQKLSKKGIPFIVFFHGWHHAFEQKVSQKYLHFFINSFGKAAKIFVLSSEAKRCIQKWGYQGEVVLETTTLEASLLQNFSLEKKVMLAQHPNPIRILFLARLIKEKGIHELLEAFQNLSKEFQNIELIIAGTGKIATELKEKTKQMNNIIWTGHVEGEAKVALFSSSHIYVLPSYSEGLPISILEAMAFALPIVTTRVGGLKAFFQEGEMGYSVEVGNAKSIQKQLRHLLQHPDEIQKIGEHNYHYAQQHLLSHTVSKRIIQHIKEVNHYESKTATLPL